MRPRYQRQLAGQDVHDDLIVRRAGPFPFSKAKLQQSGSMTLPQARVE